MRSMTKLESLYCRSKTRGGEAVVLLLLGDHEPPLEGGLGWNAEVPRVHF
jgi:hypothetical protein